MTHRQTLSKTERLKSYKRIRILFAQGQKFKVFPLVVYFLLRDENVKEVEAVNEGGEKFREVEGGLERLGKVEGVLQMGVSVGKRHFKRAVDRNLLKRRIREAYRKQKLELKETLMASGISMDVFFVYSNARISDYAEIELAMKQGLTVLLEKVKKQTSRTE
ncbi:MAG: ribonuclease P protein component [bacterium]